MDKEKIPSLCNLALILWTSWTKLTYSLISNHFWQAKISIWYVLIIEIFLDLKIFFFYFLVEFRPQTISDQWSKHCERLLELNVLFSSVRVQDGFLTFRWWRSYVPKGTIHILRHHIFGIFGPPSPLTSACF